MRHVFIASVVGVAIGVIFKSLKLPVPVPHGIAGLAGLIGMFVGSELFSMVIRTIQKG